jgi:hypothetical protein
MHTWGKLELVDYTLKIFQVLRDDASVIQLIAHVTCLHRAREIRYKACNVDLGHTLNHRSWRQVTVAAHQGLA